MTITGCIALLYTVSTHPLILYYYTTTIAPMSEDLVKVKENCGRRYIEIATATAAATKDKGAEQ